MALWADDSNARWDFLRMNLQVFPGTEKIFQSDDDLFWRLKPNLRRVRVSENLPDVEFPFRVSTDSAGRRLTGDAPAGAKTVLFLGDSCTFGIPVDDDEAFPARVGAELGARAINAGVPGYSAFQGRRVLEKFLDAEKADAVVISFWINGRTVWDHLSDAEPLLVVWSVAAQMGGGEEHPRQSLLREIGRRSGTHIVEPLEAFRAGGGEQRLYADAVHATADGYAVAARNIAEALQPILGGAP